MCNTPWCNGLVERHNGVRLTVSKTIEETNCDLNVAVAWAVSAKTSLQIVNGFFPNQLVLRKNPNLANGSNDLLLALENKTSSQSLKILMRYILLENILLKMKHHPN